jgi:hypothetical protein
VGGKTTIVVGPVETFLAVLVLAFLPFAGTAGCTAAGELAGAVAAGVGVEVCD